MLVLRNGFYRPAASRREMSDEAERAELPYDGYRATFRRSKDDRMAP